jgi:serine O-acetyltransferase
MGGIVTDTESVPTKTLLTAPSDWDRTTWAGLKEIIAEDRDVNGHSWLLPAIQMLAVYRFGVWIGDPSRPWVVSRIGILVYRVLFIYVRNVLGFEVPSTAIIGRRVRFVHQHGVALHPLVEIGDGSFVRQGVTVGARYEPDRDARFYAPPRLGRNVELGVGCAVLGAVTIGDNARIGPNAVIISDVPAGASVVAPPSRVLRLH